MRPQPLLLAALVATLAVIAVVRRDSEPDPYRAEQLNALLTQPLEARPGEDRGAPREVFWRALLAHPAASRDAQGVHLRLGRVLSDPSSARVAALAAGDLLALEAEGPEGKLGKPLWRALLDGPALERGEEHDSVRIHGCRHSADIDAGPVIEDTYHARLSLARALRAHLGAQPRPVVVLGEETPVRGGINFEVRLVGSTQSVEVTFADRALGSLRASREFRPVAANDARVRAALIATLQALAAADGTLGTLTVEGATEPVPNGVDLRLELFGPRLALVANGQGQRLSTYYEPRPSGSQP